MNWINNMNTRMEYQNKNFYAAILAGIAITGLLLSMSLQIRDLQQETKEYKGYLDYANPNWKSLTTENITERRVSIAEKAGNIISIVAGIASVLFIILGVVSFNKQKKEIIKQKNIVETNNDFYAGLTPAEQWAKYEEYKKNNSENTAQQNNK